MADPIRALIVDDEPIARDGVRLYAEDHEDLEIVGECGNGDDAVAAILERDPDLVFLDVQMPGLDGFAVLRALPEGRIPAVVFVTAYDEFALQAFEAQAMDYLLKPFDAQRFGIAVQRVRRQIQGRDREELSSRISEFLRTVGGPQQHLRRLVARRNDRILVVNVEDIDWIEGAGNYVSVHTGGESYYVREKMSELEERLDPAHFLRIHRSVIIRKDQIKSLESLYRGEYAVILNDGTRLNSSRGYRANVQAFLDGG